MLAKHVQGETDRFSGAGGRQCEIVHASLINHYEKIRYV